MNRSLDFLLTHKDYKGDDCVLWPYSCCTPGYGACYVDGRRQMAHRVMCIWTHGHPPSSKHDAAHSCGCRRCINPNHLSWKTKTNNQLDRHEHGTSSTAFGKRYRLTPAQVAEIRGLKGKETAPVTAARFGVTDSNVRQIQAGKTWVTGEYVKGGWAPGDPRNPFKRSNSRPHS